jgi:hypothetical protein
MRKPWESVLLVVIVCLAGCGKHPLPLPTTYTVHGKVTHKDGTVVDAGTVQFQSNVDTSVTTCGAIGKDGTYSLTTMRDGLESVGAVAGSNRVFITTIRHQQGRDLPFSALSPSPYDVKPRDNEFNVVVDIDGTVAEAASRNDGR